MWFWRLTARNINYDAISYLGIARHLTDRDFSSSLNGYWSPLISWCVAFAAKFSGDLTHVGRLFTIASFLFCLFALYFLTLHLWGSPLLAAFAVLWFTTARGVVAFSVYFIGADFLFTGLVLVYFILLLRCLREPSLANWARLGLPHGLAFLAKAIAMPWLAISTVLASVLAARFNARRALLCSCAAIAVPVSVWLGWGMTLKTKYGVFTPGYQARWNLIDEDTREAADRNASMLSVLSDTSRSYDSYLVADNMFPGCLLWQTRLRPALLTRQILDKERQNLPAAVKQITILLTPGGLLALVLVLWYLSAKRRSLERAFAIIVLASTVTLIIGYSMLVFDNRYVLPLVPLLVSVAIPMVLPSTWVNGSAERSISGSLPHMRIVACTLLLAGTTFSHIYRASPFRRLRRDYEVSSYDAARKLRMIPSCRKLVVVGRGPYQEHGVGWEAGIYASYFASCRMVAFRADLPSADQFGATCADLASIQPDAILLFGNKSEGVYQHLSTAIRTWSPTYSQQTIVDPEAGAVGELLWKFAE